MDPTSTLPSSYIFNTALWIVKLCTPTTPDKFLLLSPPPTTTTTVLLFSLLHHHHHHHISIVFPPLPPTPPHFYCYPSTTTTTTFLCFPSTTTTTFLLFLSTTTITAFLLFSLIERLMPFYFLLPFFLLKVDDGIVQQADSLFVLTFLLFIFLQKKRRRLSWQILRLDCFPTNPPANVPMNWRKK